MNYLKLLQLIEPTWIVRRFNQATSRLLDALPASVTPSEKRHAQLAIQGITLAAIATAFILTVTVLNAPFATTAILGYFLAHLFFVQAKTLQAFLLGKTIREKAINNAFEHTASALGVSKLSSLTPAIPDTGVKESKAAQAKQVAYSLIQESRQANGFAEGALPVMGLVALGLYAVDKRLDHLSLDSHLANPTPTI